MKKNILFIGAFIIIPLMVVNAQKLYVKGDIIVSNHGILFAGDSTEIDMGASATNQVTNNHGAYWKDSLTFTMVSGTFENTGNHRVKQDYTNQGGTYTLKHNINSDDQGADDQWGEMIILGETSGDIQVEKVFYRRPSLTGSTIIYYSSLVDGKTLSDILSDGRQVSQSNFEWLPNRVDYRNLTGTDNLNPGVAALISVGSTSNDIMSFNEVNTVQGDPFGEDITVSIWSTNHLNNMTGLNFPTREQYMGSPVPDGNAWDGWNVIANPYPASIDLNRLFTYDQNNEGLLNATAYVYRNSFREATEEQAASVGVTLSANSYNNALGSGLRMVRPFEVFAVQRRIENIDDLNNAAPAVDFDLIREDILVFTNDNSSNQEENPDPPQNNNGPAFFAESFGEQLKSFYETNNEAEEDPPLLDGIRIVLLEEGESATVLDYAYVAYKKGNSQAFDYRDGRKLIQTGNQYVYTNSLQDVEYQFPYLYNVTDQEEGQVTPLIVHETEGINNLNLSINYYSTETNKPVFLEDKLSNTITRIDPNTIMKVALSDTEDDTNRFFLHYAVDPTPPPPPSPPPPPTIEANFLVRRAKTEKNKVITFIHTDQRRLKYSVYTMTGKLVKQIKRDGNKKIKVKGLRSKTIRGKKFRRLVFKFNKRYRNTPVVIRAHNSNVSYEKLVLAN